MDGIPFFFGLFAACRLFLFTSENPPSVLTLFVASILLGTAILKQLGYIFTFYEGHYYQLKLKPGYHFKKIREKGY
jgi:hypothetical protein